MIFDKNGTMRKAYKQFIKSILILFTFTIAFGCYGQQAELIKLDKLLEIIEAPSEKIQVFNFWATWCAPCVKEIPTLKK